MSIDKNGLSLFLKANAILTDDIKSSVPTLALWRSIVNSESDALIQSLFPNLSTNEARKQLIEAYNETDIEDIPLYHAEVIHNPAYIDEFGDNSDSLENFLKSPSASYDNRNRKGDDQKGDDQKGDDQKGDDQKGDDQKGDDQKGDDQKGDDQKGDDQKGDDQNGDDQNGDDQKGDDQKGDDQNGDDQNGDDQNGDDQKGDDQKGDDQNGDDQKGDDQNGDDQNGDDQNGDDQNGDDQKGDDQKGDDQNGDDQNGDDQNGDDQKGDDQKDDDPIAKEIRLNLDLIQESQDEFEKGNISQETNQEWLDRYNNVIQKLSRARMYAMMPLSKGNNPDVPKFYAQTYADTVKANKEDVKDSLTQVDVLGRKFYQNALIIDAVYKRVVDETAQQLKQTRKTEIQAKDISKISLMPNNIVTVTFKEDISINVNLEANNVDDTMLFAEEMNLLQKRIADKKAKEDEQTFINLVEQKINQKLI